MRVHADCSTNRFAVVAGNQLLNDELQRLVSTGVVAYEEASAKAVDNADLARRCGKEPPEKDKR